MVWGVINFLQKTNERIHFYQYVTCFCSFFGGNRQPQKTFLKLTDLQEGKEKSSIIFIVCKVLGKTLHSCTCDIIYMYIYNFEISLLTYRDAGGGGPQVLGYQLTLFEPWGADYARHITSAPPPHLFGRCGVSDTIIAIQIETF